MGSDTVRPSEVLGNIIEKQSISSELSSVTVKHLLSKYDVNVGKSRAHSLEHDEDLDLTIDSDEESSSTLQ